VISLPTFFPGPRLLCLLSLVLCPFVLPVAAQVEESGLDRLQRLLATETDSVRKVGLYNDIAWEYSFINYDSSLYFTEKALALSHQLKHTYWQAVSLEMKALLMEISGQVEEAATLYIKVIKLREQLGGEGLETTYNNLGILFKGQGNHRKALAYFGKSYAIETANNHYEGIGGSLINMSVALAGLGRLDSARLLLDQAIKLARTHNLRFVLQNAYLDLASYYIRQEQPDSALYYCHRLISLAQSGTVEPETLVTARQNAADIYVERGQYQLALHLLNKVEEALPHLNNREYFIRLYATKARALAGLGQYPRAYAYLQKSAAAKDSLLSAQTVGILHDIEKKYETEKKERKITELELTATRNESERNAYIFIIIGVVAGLLFLYVLLRQKSKTNKIISQSLAEKETLLREIHHRVKNNLQIISSLLNLQAKFITDKVARKAINESQSRVKAMALIHQELYQKDNLTGINMPGFIKSLIESLLSSYRVDQQQIKPILAVADIRLDVDTAMSLGLIINELVSNTLKYAYTVKNTAVGNLSVTLSTQKDTLLLSVKDDGQGFVPADSSSYGIRLINSLARKLQARVTFESTGGTMCNLIIKKFKLV